MYERERERMNRGIIRKVNTNETKHIKHPVPGTWNTLDPFPEFFFSFILPVKSNLAVRAWRPALSSGGCFNLSLHSCYPLPLPFSLPPQPPQAAVASISECSSEEEYRNPSGWVRLQMSEHYEKMQMVMGTRPTSTVPEKESINLEMSEVLTDNHRKLRRKNCLVLKRDLW